MWVKTGNVLPYFPYDVGTHAVNFKRQAGLLPPVAKLQVKRRGMAREPVSLNQEKVAVIQKKVMAVFEKSGSPGLLRRLSVQTPAMILLSLPTTCFFFEDPHQLYKHWPADTWTAIDQHQAIQGMSELQAAFALGANISAGEGDYGNRTIEYANAGKPVTITLRRTRQQRSRREKRSSFRKGKDSGAKRRSS